MEIWLIFTLMAAATAAALYFGGRSSGGQAQDAALAQAAFYKDQLKEIERDLARGVIEPAEAASQHTEVARRLLAVARETQPEPAKRNMKMAVAAALLVPVVAFLVYGRLGAPSLPDLPQADRLARAQDSQDTEALVYIAEQHLAKNPRDALGWDVLIPIYQSLGRFGDVAFAYRNLIEIRGPSAELYANLAEMLVFQGNGVVPSEAAKAARAALALDRGHPKARYYEALGLTQDGKRDDARAKFQALLDDSPADAPWRQAVESQLADLQSANAKAPALSDEQIASVQSQPAEDQQQMIRTMVEGLAEKLQTEPRNLEGWLRLIRARIVLNEPESAKGSLATARASFADNQDALAQLAALAKELELE